jgi:hypothetical protein
MEGNRSGTAVVLRTLSTAGLLVGFAMRIKHDYAICLNLVYCPLVAYFNALGFFSDSHALKQLRNAIK